MTVRELRQLLFGMRNQDADVQLVVIVDRVPVALAVAKVVDGQAIPETDTDKPAYIVGAKPVGAPAAFLFPA